MKSLLWVEDSLIKELKMLDEVEEITQEQIKTIINKFNDEIDLLSENIDSNVLEIRAKAQKAKESYSKVVEEEINAIYELWETLDTTRFKAKEKLTQTFQEIDQIKHEVKQVNNLLNEIYQADYKLDKALNIVKTIAGMSDLEKEMLKKLL